MVMGLRNALLSMTPRTCRAAIHVNYTVIFIFSVYYVLFGMIEYLISIMFAAWILHPNPLCLIEWESCHYTITSARAVLALDLLEHVVKANKDCVVMNMGVNPDFFIVSLQNQGISIMCKITNLGFMFHLFSPSELRYCCPFSISLKPWD